MSVHMPRPLCGFFFLMPCRINQDIKHTGYLSSQSIGYQLVCTSAPVFNYRYMTLYPVIPLQQLWCEAAGWWRQWMLCCESDDQKIFTQNFQDWILNIYHGQHGSSGLAVSSNLMTFRLSGPSLLVAWETHTPFNFFMCGELWHVESQDSRSATPSYFHRKQPLRQLGLPLLHPPTVASFQGHHLRALLIIWQVFSKINYGQLLSCNYLGWRGSEKTFSSTISRAQFSTYRDVNEFACLAVVLMHGSQLVE